MDNIRKSMKVTFLGTGTSHGVPMIACNCKVCTSSNPKNKRMRTSVLVSKNGYNILIDATPELRLQCIKNNVTRLDAVLITHPHADPIESAKGVQTQDMVRMGMGNEDGVQACDMVLNTLESQLSGVASMRML